MKLLFEATAVLPIYSSAELGNVKGGEMVDVPDDLALRLLADFPENFSAIRKENLVIQMMTESTQKPKRRRSLKRVNHAKQSHSRAKTAN